MAKFVKQSVMDKTARAVVILPELEVKGADEPEQMTWTDAMAKFGDQGSDPDWRLPTREELAFMYTNRAEISGLTTDKSEFYWSSDEAITKGFVWGQRFSDGALRQGWVSLKYPVRCVRRNQRGV